MLVRTGIQCITNKIIVKQKIVNFGVVISFHVYRLYLIDAVHGKMSSFILHDSSLAQFQHATMHEVAHAVIVHVHDVANLIILALLYII